MARVEPMAPVNIRADKAYLKALKAVAYSRGQFIGDLVRDAVDLQFGDQLRTHLDYFAADSGVNKRHSVKKHDK